MKAPSRHRLGRKWQEREHLKGATSKARRSGVTNGEVIRNANLGDPQNGFAQKGFALPLVLTILAAVTLLVAASFRSVESAASIAADLKRRSEIDAALFSGEQVLAFIFLSGQPTGRGLNLGEPIDPDTLLEGAPDSEEIADDLLLTGDGVAKRLEIFGDDVLLSYRDGGAFLSFPFAAPNDVTALYRALGVSRPNADRLASVIADYQDPDDLRRAGGGERPSYRQLGRQAPSNSPLRVKEELLSTIAPKDVLTAAMLDEIDNYASFAPMAVKLKGPYLDPVLRPIFDRQIEEGGLDAPATDASPSIRARLTATVVSTDYVYRRSSELIRQTDTVSTPFVRLSLPPRTLPRDAVEGSANPASFERLNLPDDYGV